MPSFNIVKKSNVQSTFRVEKIKADFDVSNDHVNESFVGNIEYPDNWKIGVIVGASGTGKSTIAREVYGDDSITHHEYTRSSVVDDMPNADISAITQMFYAVGFGSVPSWLKPYAVLSTGEKMRVDLARAMLEKKFIVFDEFTSVVDRNVARTACIAINKAVHRLNKQFVAVSCHRDIIEWLQPDWVFDTNEMRCFFTTSRDHKKNLLLGRADAANGKSLESIII
jgi:ABC-type ATPase with predicted acetyltransferase domain